MVVLKAFRFLFPLRRLFLFGWPGISLIVQIVVLAVWGGTFGLGWWNQAAAREALARGDLQRAQDCISVTLSIWPHSAPAHFLAARIGRIREAFPYFEEHLNACQRLEGRTERVQLEWTLLRMQGGDSLEVEPGLWLCLNQKHPESTWILEALARSYVHSLRYQLAHRCLTDWLKSEPNQVRAFVLRGFVRERLESIRGAVEDYRQVLELAPENWNVRLRLADLLLVEKKTPEVLQHLKLLQADHSEEPGFILVLGKCRVQEGKLDEARDLLERAVSADPRHPQAHFELGTIELQRRRLARAEACFRKCIAADPTFANAYYSLYICLQAQGQKEKARQVLTNYKGVLADGDKLKKSLLEFEKTRKDACLVEVADILLHRDNAELARQFLLRALEIDPRNLAAHKLLVGYYSKTNNQEELAKHRKVLEQFPNPD